MIDINQILEDFMNISDSEQSLEVLEKQLILAFEKIDGGVRELYSSPEELTNFMLFFFIKSIADMLEFYRISVTACDYEDEDEDLDEVDGW